MTETKAALITSINLLALAAQKLAKTVGMASADSAATNYQKAHDTYIAARAAHKAAVDAIEV